MGCPSPDSLPAGLHSLQAGEEEEEEEGVKKRDDWGGGVVHHWRLVRSLVWDAGSNYYDPVSVSLTHFLTLFIFSSPSSSKKGYC